MSPKQILADQLKMAAFLFEQLLEDLTDAELLLRPAGKANTVAWQIGHLLSSERRMVEGIAPGAGAPLPEEFEAAHAKEAAAREDSAGMRTRDEYLSLLRAQRAATLAALERLPEADLDKDSPETIRRIAPKWANVFGLAAMHQMWHAGQLTVLRRQLGKKVMF